MPQAVAAWAASAWSGATVGAFAGATAVGTVTAVSVGLGTALVYAGAYLVTAAAIGIGISTLAGAVMGKRGVQGSASLSAGNPLQMARDPAASRRIIYGETRVSGPMLDAFVTGAKNEYLNLVIALAAHECESIGDVYFTDEIEALDGSGNATGTYSGFARVKKVLGATGQAADSDFITDSGGTRTSTDKFDRIAYLYGRFKWDQSKWPGGFPNLSAVVKGRKCYDPRTATTVWTDNPALCVRDYLLNTEFGLAVDASELDDASFIAAANVCDEAVTLAAGGTEPRYRCNGSFETSAAPATVMEKLVESMAGALVYVGGQWVCYAGAHQTPESSHLTENDLRAEISVQTKLSLRDTCNRVRGSFASPAEKWQKADFTPIVNSSYLTEDGGLEIWHDLDLSAFVTSHSQAQRLAKIDLERTRQDISAVLPCKLTALRYKPGDVVPVDNAEMGWSGKLFMVTGIKFSTYDVSGELALGVDVTVRETASAVWDWNSGLETTYDPAANTNLWNPQNVPTPTGLGLSTSNFRQADGSISPRLKVVWDSPADQFVYSGGKVHLEYKKSADSTWIPWARHPGYFTEDYITDVQTGVSYDVRVAFENSNGAVGLFATSSATISNDTTLPGVITSLTATAQAEAIWLKWINPADSDFRGAELFEHTVDDYATATSLGIIAGTGFIRGGLAGGATRYYWARAVDTSGNVSAQTGEAHATAIDAPAGEDGTDGTDGNDGLDAVSAFLTNEAHTLPADAAGNVSSFAGAVTVMKVILGITDDTSNWSFARTENNTTSSLAGATLTVTGLSADVGYVDITATRTGYPSQVKRFSLSKSRTGAAGAAGSDAKLVVLTSDAQTFQYPKAGGVNPSSITFTATGQNLTGSPTFSIHAGTATLTGSGNTRNLVPADMVTEAITVKVAWDGQEDFLSVVKVREGADGTPGADGADGAPGAPGADGANAPQTIAPVIVQGSSPVIQIQDPGGTPSGWRAMYTVNGGSVQARLASQLSLNVNMGSTSARMVIWGEAPGYSPSATQDADWNDLS